jgi:DNA topoisomerase VI subunit B
MDRIVSATSLQNNYFSPQGLQRQIGYGQDDWGGVLLKELIDNALDACEQAGVAPVVRVNITDDYFEVTDNAGGMPPRLIARSTDYRVQVSTKAKYVSPTRGQIGNALKCAWTAPLVAQGKSHTATVWTGGEKYDLFAQSNHLEDPSVTLAVSPASEKNGTTVRVHLGGTADAGSEDFYDPEELLQTFCLFNPHATFVMSLTQREDEWTSEARTDHWKKWRGCDEPSALWYGPKELGELVQAHVKEGHGSQTVREFVIRNFEGLTGKARGVVEEAGLAGKTLGDLFVEKRLDETSVQNLLTGMQNNSREVNPDRLGEIGKEHLFERLCTYFPGLSGERYRKASGTVDGRPYLVEVAFAELPDEYASSLFLRIGVNNSPANREAFRGLTTWLSSECQVEMDDAVAVLIHVSMPRAGYTDSGKTTVALPDEIEEALKGREDWGGGGTKGLLHKVTSEWTKMKLKTERREKLTEKKKEEIREPKKEKAKSIEAGCFEVMEESYRHVIGRDRKDASGKWTQVIGRGSDPPAKCRQIMYRVRTLVLAKEGYKWFNPKSAAAAFRSTLKKFLKLHPEHSGWNVVYDARGHFREPHTEKSVDIGQIDVRRYVGSWDESDLYVDPVVKFPDACEHGTPGPKHRFEFALFIEKEGFNDLLAYRRIQERYDIALFSTKGMSTSACRELIDRLSQAGVTTLVAHDFDKTGVSINHTLGKTSDAYTYKKPPKLIQIGLTWEDVVSLDLAKEGEDVELTKRTKPNQKRGKDPREKLREMDVPEDGVRFLCSGYDGDKRCYVGKRVELNHLTNDRFIQWLEGKFKQHGVCKVVPPEEHLKKVYEEGFRRTHVKTKVERSVTQAQGQADKLEVEVPEDLVKTVGDAIKDTTTPWHEELSYKVEADYAENPPPEESPPPAPGLLSGLV